VAERSTGLLNAQEGQRLVQDKLRSGELIPIGTLVTDAAGGTRYIDRTEMRFTTPEILQLERQMLRHVERVVQGPDSSIESGRVERALQESSRPLDDEQKNAVRWLASGEGVRLLSGLAGTGKTWTLETCRELWEADGREVIGCAVAAAAAKRLENGTDIKSSTLDSLLNRLDRGETWLHSKSVVVLDEAGMIGTKQTARLLEHVANVEGARLILVGDAKQLQAISAGGPFKYLGETLGEASLTTVRRQEQQWSRDAVKDFHAGRSREAISAYVEQGCFHLADTRPQAMAQLIEQWKGDGGIFEPKSVLMLGSLNSEVKELNLRAQAERIRAGEVDAERKIYASGVYFHEGDRVQFLKNSTPLGVANADTGTVLRVDPERERIRVKLDDTQREIDVSFNRYQPENLRLGCASTTHKAQGATVPHVHVLMGGMYSDLHMTYVQASRSQISTHLFCDKTTAGQELADLVRAAAHERPKTLAKSIVDQARHQVERQHEDIRRAPAPELDQQHQHDHRRSLSL
jgi:ATP-dependent exoDNAse (exonuclease V) alpha subunit